MCGNHPADPAPWTEYGLAVDDYRQGISRHPAHADYPDLRYDSHTNVRHLCGGTKAASHSGGGQNITTADQDGVKAIRNRTKAESLNKQVNHMLQTSLLYLMVTDRMLYHYNACSKTGRTEGLNESTLRTVM